MSNTTTHLFPSITATIKAKLASLYTRFEQWEDRRYSRSAHSVAHQAWMKAAGVNLSLTRTQSDTFAQAMKIANLEAGQKHLQDQAIDNYNAIVGLQAGLSLSGAKHEYQANVTRALRHRVERLETALTTIKHALEFLDEPHPGEDGEDMDQLDLFEDTEPTDEEIYVCNVVRFGGMVS